MSDIAIKVENLSKLYQLGEVGTGTLSKDLNRWWARVRGKENPYAKVGQINDRSKKAESDFVWALKYINFEVKQGEVLGIIGKNGAGKSTLLKILSKITSPTTGKIYTKGRIASLLEVGTGFHPEMTGRENIYLNGAILGMRKWEIDKKFDEIVDFAGVEAYIDTPVKRYSSGMYVRLAFAVAAFLEPEILIVDEVLAVGDAEFQKKCLGRMKDVSANDGRTVLFVSHNIASLGSLCSNGIVLKNGLINFKGQIQEAIQDYLQNDRISKRTDFKLTQIPTIVKDALILSSSIRGSYKTDQDFFDVFEIKEIIYEFQVYKKLIGVTPIIEIVNQNELLFNIFLSDADPKILDGLDPGIHKYIIEIPYALKKGYYKVNLRIGKLMVDDLDYVENALSFEVKELSFNPSLVSYSSFRKGLIPCISKWIKQN